MMEPLPSGRLLVAMAGAGNLVNRPLVPEDFPEGTPGLPELTALALPNFSPTTRTGGKNIL